MLWHLSFWLLVVLIVIPLPFKIYEYLSGKDKSPLIVKIEEMSNAIFTAIGLIAFYGFLNNESYLFPAFWEVWLIIAVLWMILPIFWSPKLDHARKIMGAKKTGFWIAFSCALHLPLLLAVYFYVY